MVKIVTYQIPHMLVGVALGNVRDSICTYSWLINISHGRDSVSRPLLPQHSGGEGGREEGGFWATRKQLRYAPDGLTTCKIKGSSGPAVRTAQTSRIQSIPMRFPCGHTQIKYAYYM